MLSVSINTRRSSVLLWLIPEFSVTGVGCGLSGFLGLWTILGFSATFDSKSSLSALVLLVLWRGRISMDLLRVRRELLLQSVQAFGLSFVLVWIRGSGLVRVSVMGKTSNWRLFWKTVGRRIDLLVLLWPVYTSNMLHAGEHLLKSRSWSFSKCSYHTFIIIVSYFYSNYLPKEDESSGCTGIEKWSTYGNIYGW